MKNTHYHTLGLANFATLAEVKQAYRRLAKQFHPDVNPQGKEIFTKVTAAYEVLGDSSKKYIYDSQLKRNSHSDRVHQSNQKKKWSFQEQELKRRQYYQEHYKKQYQQQQQNKQAATPPKNYNEYKYILFATPLAVVLVLVILGLYQKKSTLSTLSTTEKETVVSLTNGEFPFASYFGPAQYTDSKSRQIIISNTHPEDVICLLFQGEKFWRGCYLKQNYSATISRLPNDTLELRYMRGRNWCATCENKLSHSSPLGRFKTIVGFYQTHINPKNASTNYNVTLNDTLTLVASSYFFKRN